MASARFSHDLTLKLLFQVDVGHLPVEEVLTLAFEEVPVSEGDQEAIGRTVRAILAEQPELDAIIGDLAEGWRVERLANVDKNVLRLALHHLRHQPRGNTPRIIDQAIELAKKYSTAESGKFVNGILGAYVRKRDPGEGGDAEGVTSVEQAEPTASESASSP